MEKKIRIYAALLALVILSGCAADNKPVQSEPQTSASSESASAVSQDTQPVVSGEETDDGRNSYDTGEAASSEEVTVEHGS